MLQETSDLRRSYRSAIAFKRVPMRNWMEGHFTAWHRDLAYCHVEPALRRLYPSHPTLPAVNEVLEWWARRKANKALLGKILSGALKASQTEREMAFLEQSRLYALELKWAPPPRESVFKTPIPVSYFSAALGRSVQKWSSALPDLVPLEQRDLLQDSPECPAWERICSADARACVSLCRPVGQIVEKRKLPGKAGVWNTMPHQSGGLANYPLHQAQDDARGMLTGVVAKTAFSKDLFELRAGEPQALESVLPWLQAHNPWLAAYQTSLREVHAEMQTLQAEMSAYGRTLPGGLESMKTKDGKSLVEALEDEDIALLLPTDVLKQPAGSYSHLRAVAETICTSSLRQALPDSWQELEDNSICDNSGAPVSSLPKFLDLNTAFTKVSFLDSHVEAKLFVKQFRWGTGSFSSSLDCVTIRQVYRRARFWSLDGEYLDDADPMWLFWQREHEYKMRLFEDWRGKDRCPTAHLAPSTGADPPPATSDLLASATTIASHTAQKVAAYSKATFSQRLGSLIPESPQSLTRHRHAWLEAARPENLGPPTSMTTFVGNPRAAAITAHVASGPCAAPDPEQTWASLRARRAELPGTRHVAIKAADYLRRRTDLETVSYDTAGRGALHGQVPHRCRRGEEQKRGDKHDHYNNFCEPCCFPLHIIPRP